MPPKVVLLFVCIMMISLCLVRSRASPAMSFLSLVRSSASSSSDITGGEVVDGIHIVSSTTSYSSKFRQIITKKIHFAKRDKTFDFDITSNCGTRAVAIFPFDTTSKTLTLVSEFHPGPERFMYGLPAGCIEPHKHTSVLMAAEQELEEEAQLRAVDGKEYVSLLDDSESQFLPMDKYTDNGIHPYLVLDAQLVDNPRAQDEEENITVHRNMSYREVIGLIKTGSINTVSAASILLGYQKLDELNIEYK
jgi:8-oxo-dGTP pyrophosphatase MutT (NUDIX family)